MTAESVRRSFHLQLAACITDVEAIAVARGAVFAGVPMHDVAAALDAWGKLRAAEVQYLEAVQT